MIIRFTNVIIFVNSAIFQKMQIQGLFLFQNICRKVFYSTGAQRISSHELL